MVLTAAPSPAMRRATHGAKKYEAELSGSVMPLLDGKFEELDGTSAEVLTRFFAHYHGMVAFHSSQQARDKVLKALEGDGMIATKPRDYNRPLETLALEWALGQRAVGSVVVGLTKPAHAAAALATASAAVSAPGGYAN